VDSPRPNASTRVPFDAALLDGLLDDAGVDVLLATSKHNVQYLLGGYRSFFFDVIDAIGLSRYLPVFVYRKGKPEQSAFIGSWLDGYEIEHGKFWTPTVRTRSITGPDAMRHAIEHVRGLGPSVRRIGSETGFLPVDAQALLQQAFPDAVMVDATFPLERLRARKTPDELELLREASERVVASMLEVFERSAPGMTKADLVRELRRAEVSRDLAFEYCLITAGTSHNRAPSAQTLTEGDIISLDSGGNFHGYVGDLCRMGILGNPDAELHDLLSGIEEIQQAARRPIRPGVRGGDLMDAGQSLVDASLHKSYLDFTVHGLGLITHEAPRLTTTGPVPYPAYDQDRRLEAGMVVSIETTMQHPTRGFIKLEDTVAVTEDGPVGYGDAGRGWNRARA
jgi:Xaa-Pro aminopeptidase